MNDENLISIADRPEDEQREISRKGGQASGEARRQRKTMRERLEYLMTTPNAQGIEHGEAIAETLIKCATDGNMKAAKLIGDYCGDFKQRIEVEDTTAPRMTKEEAEAVYYVRIKQLSETLLNPEAGEVPEETQLFKEAVEILGKRPEDITSESMSYTDTPTDLIRTCWNLYNQREELRNAIREAAGMPRDEANAHIAATVEEYRNNTPDFQKRFDTDFEYNCLTLYLCARSEQYRKDHPEEAAPPPPPSPHYRPAPGQPYPEEW